jgi:hypothetical protein
MKKTTKTTIQGYTMNAGILLMLWSGIPFFISLGGVAVWTISVFVTLILPIIFIGLYISDGAKLDADTLPKVMDMKDTLNSKKWVRKLIGWSVALLVSWSLYEHGWVVVAYYWMILTVTLNVVVMPLLRSRVEDILKAYEATKVDELLKEQS